MLKSEIITKLQELAPLLNYHYGWILPPVNDALLYEYARVTRSLGLYHRWATAAQIDKCVRILSSLPVSNLPPVLSFTIRPWHEKFDSTLPPTDTGPTCQAEIDLLVSRCEFIKDTLEKANVKYNAHIKIGAFLLDSERFVRNDRDSVWNQAIVAKYNIFNHTLKQYFPDTRLEWYGCGIVSAPSISGWSNRPWHQIPGETLERLSNEMYTVWEPDRWRTSFRKTCELSDSLGLREVTPWVALGCGHERVLDNRFHAWNYDVRYPLIYSWMLGGELNHPWYGTLPERFLDNTRIKAVCFYPGIGDKHVPKSWEHFISYCRGAAIIRKLEDLK